MGTIVCHHTSVGSFPRSAFSGVQASSAPGAWVLDFFAGSGTTGAVARELGRRFVLVDDNPEAVAVMRQRLGTDGVRYVDARGLGDLSSELSSPAASAPAT